MPTVSAIIVIPIALLAFFNFNSHKLEQKILNFFQKKGVKVDKLMVSEKSVDESKIYEKGRLYAAAIYLPAIMCSLLFISVNFNPEVSFRNYAILSFGVFLGLLGFTFVFLFYYFEYKSYKIIYPKIKFWQYFTARVFLNSLDS
jgi:hypothetical protein